MIGESGISNASWPREGYNVERTFLSGPTGALAA